MSVLRAFAPFIVFLIGARLVPVQTALWLAFGTACALFAWSRVREPRTEPKILEIGTVALFGLIALGARFLPMQVGVAVVRLVVDAGLCVVVLISLALGTPFTLQYARERAPREVWAQPRFIALNIAITRVWAFAFALNGIADALLAFVPQVPAWCDVALAATSLAGAYSYSTIAPKRARERGAAAS